MYLLLLVFGAVLTAAGIVLAASGMSIHEQAFDASIVTPGMVAVVGGLLLFGLGLALRVLQRIERALALRPMPRVARPGETVALTAAAERPSEPGRIPLPSKIAPRPPLLAATAPSAAPVSAGEKRARGFARKSSGCGTARRRRVHHGNRAIAVAKVAVSNCAVERGRGRHRGRQSACRGTKKWRRADTNCAAARHDRPFSSCIPDGRSGPAFDLLGPNGPRPARAAPVAAHGRAGANQRGGARSAANTRAV